MKLLTPVGTAGIAVLRADPGERARLESALRSPLGGALTLEPGGPPRRAALRIDGLDVDDVLVVDRGSLGVELHVHGAPVVVDALRMGFRLEPAAPSSVAEGVLRRALSYEQAAFAVEQAGYDFGAFCAALAAMPPARRRAAKAAALHRSAVARALIEPLRIVLVGAQNAGKSSLFNALLFRERVLTGPEPGLTRDPVAETTALAGYPYELVDAAGEGPAASDVDARALTVARQERVGAATLLVIDRAVGPTALDRALASHALLVIGNKVDLAPASWPADVPCHAMLAGGRSDPAVIRAEVGRVLRERRGLPMAGPVGGAAALDAEQWRQLADVGD